MVSSQSAGAETRTASGKPRYVFVHYHIFKNAGTTIDGILERNFRGRLAYLHGDRYNATLSNAGLLEFLQQNSEVMAVSSHHLRPPKPENDAFVFFDIVFLRYPLDRLRSIYDFYRRVESSHDPVAAAARSAGLKQFVEHLLTSHPHLVNDPQVNFLANGGRYTHPPTTADLESAVAVITQAAVPGVTERLELSLRAARYYLCPAFGKLDMRCGQENVSPGRLQTLEVRLKQMRQTCGRRLYDKLLEMNALDLKLLERADLEIDRRLRGIPDFDSSLATLRPAHKFLRSLRGILHLGK